jgi:uncharacterized protein YuzE
MVQITYEKDTDILYMQLSDNKIVDSDEVSEGVIVDYDEDRNIVGVEFLDFSASKDFQRILEQYVKDKAA